MKCKGPILKFTLAAVLCSLSIAALAQTTNVTAATATTSAVPRLINYSGVLKNSEGKTLTIITGVTFLLYKDEQGGAPLWLETQNVTPDRTGHYSVQLGTTSASGLPSDLFVSGEARWLAVQVVNDAEQPRVLLVAVPYAMKAADAETIGGLPPSAFVLAAPPSAVSTPTTTENIPTSPSSSPVPPLAPSNVTTTGGTANTIPMFTTATNIQNSILTQTGTAAINVAGKLNLPATGTATATAGKNSQPLDQTASAFNSSTKKAVSQLFQWQAEPASNNTSAPVGTLNLLFASGGAALSETGLKINSKGQFTFAAGQTYPGTITDVKAGTDLLGGGTSGVVTLNLDTTKVPQLNTANVFTGNQSVTGKVSVTGSVSAASFTGSGSGLTGVNAQNFAGLPLADFALQIQSNTFPADQFFNGNGGTMIVGDPGCGFGFSGIGFGSLGGCTNYAMIGDGSNVYINRPTGGQIHLRENNGEQMTIQSGGNVVISVPDSGFLNDALLVEANDANSQNIAIEGFSSGIGGIAIFGEDDNGIASVGLQGVSNSGVAVFASGNAAVTGNLTVDGSISAGTKDFKIDHPLDPANEYLYHASVESSEMMNIYTGNVTTDSQGDALVPLPAWFEALNDDFRYQLTVVGQFAQAIVGSEIANHQFTIKTDKPNVKVSWLVTGVRHDAFARLHPLVVEEQKPANQRGYYMHPEAFGQPPERQTMWAVAPQRMRHIKERQAKAKVAQERP